MTEGTRPKRPKRQGAKGRKHLKANVYTEDVRPEHAWERQPEETDAAWAYFVIYRDMPPHERTLTKAAQTVGRQTEAFSAMSYKHDWVARVHEYDNWKDRQSRIIELEEIRAMKRRHIEIAMALQSAGSAAINKIVKAEQSGEALTLKPSEVKDLVDLGIKIERLNRGEPNEIETTKIELTQKPAVVSDYSALSLEELRTLRELTLKAKQGG